MVSIARAALSSWGWRPEVILSRFSLWAGYFCLAGAGCALLVAPRKTGVLWAAKWRPTFEIIGLLADAGFAWMSPLDVLVQQLFFMHMIQHLLLITAVPVFLLLPNPMPFVLWGLPPRARLAALAWRQQRN